MTPWLAADIQYTRSGKLVFWGIRAFSGFQRGSVAHGDSNRQSDFRTPAGAWCRLPEAVKAGILAMVTASRWR